MHSFKLKLTFDRSLQFSSVQDYLFHFDLRNLFQSVKHPNSITQSVTEKEKKTQENEKEKLNNKEKENEKEAMTVSHARFQYYQQNYCLVLMSGLFGCRWHRYQQSTRNNRKVKLHLFLKV